MLMLVQQELRALELSITGMNNGFCFVLLTKSSGEPYGAPFDRALPAGVLYWSVGIGYFEKKITAALGDEEKDKFTNIILIQYYINKTS